AAALTDDAGRLLGIYRKMWLYGWERELFRPGGELPLFSVDGWQVGLLICYDAEFPDPARKLARQGAGRVVVSSGWPRGAGWRWALQLPARALATPASLLGVNEAGSPGCAGTCFVGPAGRPRARLATPAEGVVLGRLS